MKPDEILVALRQCKAPTQLIQACADWCNELNSTRLRALWESGVEYQVRTLSGQVQTGQIRFFDPTSISFGETVQFTPGQLATLRSMFHSGVGSKAAVVDIEYMDTPSSPPEENRGTASGHGLAYDGAVCRRRVVGIKLDFLDLDPKRRGVFLKTAWLRDITRFNSEVQDANAILATKSKSSTGRLEQAKAKSERQRELDELENMLLTGLD